MNVNERIPGGTTTTPIDRGRCSADGGGDSCGTDLHQPYRGGPRRCARDRGGRPVQGLTPADFEVLDNGVRQRVDLASFEQIPLNVVLALDMSASLQGLRLGHLQAASRTLLDGLKPGDRSALVAFSHVVAPGGGLDERCRARPRGARSGARDRIDVADRREPCRHADRRIGRRPVAA